MQIAKANRHKTTFHFPLSKNHNSFHKPTVSSFSIRENPTDTITVITPVAQKTDKPPREKGLMCETHLRAKLDRLLGQKHKVCGVAGGQMHANDVAGCAPKKKEGSQQSQYSHFNALLLHRMQLVLKNLIQW